MFLVAKNLLPCRVLLILLCGLFLTACLSEAEGEGGAISSAKADGISENQSSDGKAVLNTITRDYRTIEWTELMPEDDLEAIMNPPGYLDDIADGSLEDQINNQIENAIVTANDGRYQQALVSTRVVEALNNQPVKVPGFIVPLEFDGEQTITSFFLVPYFGACIHVPPPPPNQIIYGSFPKGFKLESLNDPFWINGVLKTSLTENDTATSAYTIEIDSIEPYDP